MNKIKPITDEEYAECNPLNRQLVEEYLESSSELSDRTIEVYRSNLRIWLVWIKNNLDNKKITEIKPRDFLRYQNWLVNMGHSSSDIGTKRSSVSSLNRFIEVYYLDEYPMFRNCVNASVKTIPKNYINEKQPPTREEIENMCKTLEESNRKNKYEYICYLKFCFETGCRRAEAAQIMKSIVNAEKVEKLVKVRDEYGNVTEHTATYYLTDKIRCKGRGKVGKIRQLKFSDYSMDWIKKWLESRGEDDIDNLFITNVNGVLRPASKYTFNEWCGDLFSKLLGRRMTPHFLRHSAATDVVVARGKDIEAAKALLGHESSEITKIYVHDDSMNSEDDELFI